MKWKFGSQRQYNLQEVLEAEDLMVFVATPFFINQKIFYPMYVIDSQSSRYGVETYVDLVQRLRKLNQRERYELLKKYK